VLPLEPGAEPPEPVLLELVGPAVRELDDPVSSSLSQP
jgi:hypothetical protein